MRGRPRPLADRFWANVNKNGPTMPGMESPCWVWEASTNVGYGQISVGKTMRHTQRVGYELQVGPIPDGHDVCHRCDNPPCVRGDHLFTGTPRQNQMDKVAKGRQYRGARHHETHLDDASVASIRSRYTAGESQTVLAKEFSVTQTSISGIVNRLTWRHVA